VAGHATAERSRDLGSEATRRAILDAAGALLADKGEDGLSIREVCARASVTPPTIYHHFGDKAALVARIVDDCFADFDRAFQHRAAPHDPVEALRWGFDRYVEYGLQHPVPYRLMFGQARSSVSASGVASYDGLRRNIRAVDAVGRLRTPVDEAAAAFWAAVHGVTALLVSGFWNEDNPAIALVRDAMITQLTNPPRASARRGKKGAPR